MLLFALLGPAQLFWLRLACLAIGTAFTLYAHTWTKTPQMQYAMWAHYRSLEPRLWASSNLCGVQSRLMGVIAVGVAMALNILLLASTIASSSIA